jgi:hypothetical protein
MILSPLRRNITTAFLSLLLIVAGAKAQTGTSSLRGTVTDKSGAAISGARVSLSNTAQAVNRATVSSDTGAYAFQALPPGNYTLSVELASFRRYERKDVELLVNVPNTVDVRMEIGEASSVVEVTGQIETVNTTDATLGNAFDSRQVLALPFEGREAASILSLQPGVLFLADNAQRDTNVDSRSGALNGGRSDQANITLDGVDNNRQLTGDAFQGAVRSTLDSIEEFRVTTGGANADQGRSSGGQIALVTKSGTNNFHGSAYLQDRSHIGEANDWFNKHAELNSGQPNTPQGLSRNVFGASLGGPIIKDRLFFFGTYEGLRQNEAQQFNRNVPSSTLRDGIVEYPCAPVVDANGNVTKTATQVCPAGNTVTGASGTIYPVAAGAFGLGPAQIKTTDPNCTGLGTCPQGNGPDPAALAVFRKYPQPNSQICTNNDGFNIGCYTFSSPLPKRQNTSIAKLDYNLTKSGTHRLFIRGNYQADAQSSGSQFSGTPANSVLRDTSRALGVGYTAVFSSTLVNSFHYGFTRQSVANVGLETQGIVDFRLIDNLVPRTSTAAFHLPVHNFVDDLSWTKGKHTLQFGTNLRRIDHVSQSNATSFNSAETNFAFLNTAPAGNGGSLDPAAFGFPAVDPASKTVYNGPIIDLVGIITQATANSNQDKTGKLFGQGQPVPRDFRAWEYEWYMQDVWHATTNLTITAGLRYDILEPPYEVNGNQAAPDISLNDFVTTRGELAAKGQIFSPTFGFNLSGQGNGKKPYWPYDFKNLGPRLAIAYAPAPSGGLLRSIFGEHGKSSIRAGFGIVYDHFGQGIVNSFDQTGTFGLSTSVTNAASVQSIDGGARFTALNNIPVSSSNGVLLSPAPGGGFPKVPPISTLASNFQQIAYGLDDKLKTPYSELVDLSVTRELPGGLTFEAAYVGRFAHRLLVQRDLAAPVDLKDPKSGMDYYSAATKLSKAFYSGATTVAPIPYWENLFPGAAGTCGAGTSATQCIYELYQTNIGPGTFGETNAIFNFDSFCFPACLNQQPGQAPGPSGQPGGPFQFYNPQYTALYAWSSIGFSNYNAGQFTLRSRPTHGLQFDFNYTYSKSIDIGSDAERAPNFGGLSAVINTWSPYQLRGVSDFDTTHSINANFIQDLPFGRGKRFGHDWGHALDALAGGWQVSGIGRWTSGLPFSVSDGFTFPTNFQLSGNAFNTKPVQTGLSFLGAAGDPFAFTLGPGSLTTPLSPNPDGSSNFRFAFPGESGQRNNFRGQGFFGIDMGVSKSIRFKEGWDLRLNAYAFNVTNSVRFDPATISAALDTAPSFGQYSQSLTSSRRFEFGARFSF